MTDPTQVRTVYSSIGEPIRFISGQFASHTIRTELTEVQKADLGRKYATVDRRPLDPPPAVLLRLFYVFNQGTAHECEREVDDYDKVQDLGLLCSVDLFPVPAPDPSNVEMASESQPAHASSSSSLPQLSPYYSQDVPPMSSLYSTYVTYPQRDAMVTSSPNLPSIPGYLPPSDANADIVAYLGKFPITESSKCTSALVGSTVVQPAKVVHCGKNAQIFAFADLAVKNEGTFILRYRMFDIYSKAYGNEHLTIQGECFGGPFRVYATKDFPGLNASTELTKRLGRWGVRLNIRETERKRKKKKSKESINPPAHALGEDRYAGGSSQQDMTR